MIGAYLMIAFFLLFEQEFLDHFVELLLVFEVQVVLAVWKSMQPGIIVRCRLIEHWIGEVPLPRN